jgi:hypothetical protein
MNLHFNKQFIKMGGRFWSMVGVPLQHNGWIFMKSRIAKFSLATGFDVRKNDCTTLQPFRELVCLVRLKVNNSYTEVEKKRVCNLQIDKKASYYVLGNGEVRYKPDGQSSGDSDTLIDNTIMSKLRNYACFAYAYFKEKRTWPMKHQNAEYWVDNIIGDDVDASFVGDSWWTAEKYVRTAFELFGVHIKMENDDPVNPEDSEFVSQHSTYDRGTMLPFGKFEKMMAGLYYGNEQEINVSQTLQRVLAYRMISWPKKSSFKYFDEVSSLLFQKYDVLMRGEVEWDNALKSYFTEGELSELWTKS